MFFSKKEKKPSSEHIRWTTNTPVEDQVWNYYNDKLVSALMHAAFAKKKTLSLKRLYHILSMTRRRCECVKLQFPESETDILFSATHALSENLYDRDFGDFQGGGTGEQGIFIRWGDKISALAKHRIPFQDAVSKQVGLSKYIRFEKSLNHPFGYMLVKLEPDFQQLLSTHNFFDYLKCSARMMFVLSNYPPIHRGSSAVNTWMFEGLKQVKFGIQENLRPHLGDWFAFFETQEQYTAFYVISTTVNYLKTIPGMSEKHHALFDQLPSLMFKDPSLPGVLDVRETFWKNIKKIVHEMITTDKENNPFLLDIYNGQLNFTKPSQEIHLRAFVDKLNATDENDINFDDIFKAFPDNFKSYIRELLQLNRDLTRKFQTAFGNPEAEKKLNAKWANLQILIHIKYEHFWKLEEYFNITCPLKTDSKSDSGIRSPYAYFLRMLHGKEEELSEISDEVKQLLTASHPIPSLQTQLKKAVRSGGIHIDDLNALSLNQLEALTSDLAIKLYSMNQCITVKDLIDEDPSVIEKNTLKLAAKVFHHEEDLPNIYDPEIRETLCKYHPVFSEGKTKVSALTGKTVTETNRLMLTGILQNCPDVKDPSDIMDNLTDDEANKYLKRLSFVFFSEATRDLPFHKKIDILRESDLLPKVKQDEVQVGCLYI